MTEPTSEPTASEMHEARKTQIQAVVAGLETVRGLVREMKGSALGGFDLWLGGPPPRIAQVENYANNTARMIADDFGVSFNELPIEED